MSELTTVFQKGKRVKYCHHSLLEATMEDNQQNVTPLLNSSLLEKIAMARRDVEAFYEAMQEMVKDPTSEKIEHLRDQAFEQAENEFELSSILSRLINQTDPLDMDDSDYDEEDYEWADDQMMFGLIEEAFELLKSNSELLNRMKHYRRHILLELDEHEELPRALSGLHDTLLERLEELADVRNDL